MLGANGPPGDRGVPGLPGPTGATGGRGPRGAQGEQGIQVNQKINLTLPFYVFLSIIVLVKVCYSSRENQESRVEEVNQE